MNKCYFFFWQITNFPNGYKGAGWEAACFIMKSGAQCYLQFVATLTKWEKYSFSRQGFGSTVMTISILAINKWGPLCHWVTAMPYTIWFPERALKPLAYKHKVLSQEYAELSTSNPAMEQHSDQVWEFPATQFFCGIIKERLKRDEKSGTVVKTQFLLLCMFSSIEKSSKSSSPATLLHMNHSKSWKVDVLIPTRLLEWAWVTCRSEELQDYQATEELWRDLVRVARKAEALVHWAVPEMAIFVYLTTKYLWLII